MDEYMTHTAPEIEEGSRRVGDQNHMGTEGWNWAISTT
jgi:hypothetical protein